MKRIYSVAASVIMVTLFLAYARTAEYGTPNPVSIITDERGSEMVIYLKNRTVGTYTVSVYFKKLVNASADKPLPYTMVIEGGKTELCLTVRQSDKDKRWDTFFMYDFQPGSMNSLHDEKTVYSLPYLKGEEYRVIQGYNGKYTHNGGFRYSIDWYMPVGTMVLAARKGIVTETVDTFSGHGLKPYYYDRNNYVIIEHDDGTIARYVHLRKGGVTVRPGDIVEAGDIIGYSGDVGYSNIAHLHFSVHRPVNGKESESLPVKFRISDTCTALLEEGKSYRAWEVR